MTKTWAGLNGPCGWCGHEHRHRGDREACDAIHGRIRPYDAIGPDYRCNLCGLIAPWGPLLEHFGAYHRGEHPDTGSLVRPIRTIEGGL